ncbi:DUF998 domain-containing protein [Mycolicibacterium sp. P9-64]|uniref:DUF998 domain-containing protein n=1 Tax=Mycolicibacterium sp. P9-64 TaxID=2024612 RepID=UPI001F5B8D86|nr:DUF998 domain-containing protein [Mycolicibacterium sp. P9-64]
MTLRIGALSWVVSAFAYFVAEAVAASAMPRYGYATDFISTLGAPGLSPLAPLMNAAFVVQAILFPVGAALMVKGTRARRASVFLVVAGLNGIGNFLVATWHSGPAGTGPDLHGVGAFLAIAGGNLAVLLGTLAFRRADVSRTYLAVSLAIGVMGLVFLLGLILDTSLSVLPIGTWERGSVYSIYVWQTFTAVYFLRRTAERSERAA